MSTYESYNLHRVLNSDAYNSFKKRVENPAYYSKYYAKATDYAKAINANYQKVRAVPAGVKVWTQQIINQNACYHLGILYENIHSSNVHTPSIGTGPSSNSVHTWVSEAVIGYRLNIVF